MSDEEEWYPNWLDERTRGLRYRESTKNIVDVSSLLGVLRDEVINPEIFVFRGQSDWEWELRPVLGRDSKPDEVFSDFGVDEESRTPPQMRAPHVRYWGPADLGLISEKETFRDWKSEAIALLPPTLARPSSDIEWLALGRHHGLPTRLLDWTRNPLVGAYFAVAGPSEGKDSALFAMRGLPLISPALEDDPWDVRGVRLWHPPSLADRIGRQSSVFTVHQIGWDGGSMDLVAYAAGLWWDDRQGRKEQLSELVHFELVKLRIEAAYRGKLLDELRLLGVDEFFAFPDLGGLCRAYERGRFRRPGVGQNVFIPPG